MRNRTWLQSFLNLGARAFRDGVPGADVARQEDTVLRALDLLDERPGVVLADEVGMGKTFEALGVVAAFRRMRPDGRIVILTPGPDLNTKWDKELARFSDGQQKVHDFADDWEAVTRLADFVAAIRRKKIVVAPMNVFSSLRAGGAQAHLLSLFFAWKGDIHGHTANAILRRFRDGELDRVDVRSERFLGLAGWDDLEPHLEHAFAGEEDDEQPTLGGLYQAYGLAGFERDDVVRRALDTARFRLVRALLPAVDLVVLDEAHKLKNATTVRSRAVSTVFRKKFEKALFLTATPFQLDVGELRQVFAVFALATSAPPSLAEEVDRLFADIRDYQDAYAAFETAWLGIDAGVAADFTSLYERDPDLVAPGDDPSLRDLAARVRRLVELRRDRIEPAFRAWMIRSLRDDKRVYRRHQRERRLPAAGSALPFLLYERFLAELYRVGGQTHKASVEINMVSSYGAACEGALLAAESDGRFEGDLEAYRGLLRDVLGELRGANTEHPKMRFVLDDALDAATRGEKTLVFCARIATLSDLARDVKRAWEARLVERWRKVYPAIRESEVFDEVEEDGERARGLHSRLQARLHRPQDALYLALRERYVHAIPDLAEWAEGRLDAIVAEANVTLRGVRTGGTSASRFDWRIAKRCVEQAVAIVWRREEPAAASEAGPIVSALTHPEYVALGLDLEPDELEAHDDGDETPSWTISRDAAGLVVRSRPSLWSYLKSGLDPLPLPRRVQVVERLARYLGYKHVPFLADLVASAHRAGLDVQSFESRALLDHVDDFWRTPEGRIWIGRLAAFLRYFVDRDDREQLELLEGPISTGDFVRQTKDGESRERLREAFNTPLYPMILIANEVMQEGLDLHRSCRRVVHHDLAWNPAQLEQRVGRVDRLGSLVLQLRKKDPTATLDVVYPLVHRTIDERIYRTVKTREKWLEFLLGAVPSWEELTLDHTPPELPAALADSLRIDLRPRAGATEETT